MLQLSEKMLHILVDGGLYFLRFAFFEHLADDFHRFILGERGHLVDHGDKNFEASAGEGRVNQSDFFVAFL